MDDNIRVFTIPINLIRKVYRRIISIPRRSNPSEARFAFFQEGFHGDQYLMEIVDFLLRDCTHFVETGTNVGSTLAYVARNYPHIECLSCEPDEEAFRLASENVAAYENAKVFMETSQDFLERLKDMSPVLNSQVLFWLDAHGYGFEWPLKYELKFITAQCERAYILIDDFKVPGMDVFGYDEYKGQICSFDYVKNALNKELDYRLYYPGYTDRTSRHHPLRGWGLIEFGWGHELKFPKELLNKVRIV